MKFSEECILATLDQPKTLEELRREWSEIPHIRRCVRRLREAGLVKLAPDGQGELWGRPRKKWVSTVPCRNLSQIERAIQSCHKADGGVILSTRS